MAKFLVTSGSHFKPFTYDDFIKPIAHAQQVHDATQEVYDTLSMETNALGRYITDNPEDQQAKAMYDSYLEKLNTLQNNLWNSGVSGQTRKDLSAARAGYASDITRLGQAIKTRQERSKAYWDTWHNHPDMIMGKDPGESGLDNYLRDAQYGQNYYSYSSESFMKEVGADAAARASEMLRDPRIEKDPRMQGYLLRIEKDGFTSQEVQNAADAVRLAMAGNSTALSGLDEPSSILANVLMSHINSSGAVGNVDSTQLGRLVDYGVAGLSQAIGKTNTTIHNDKVFDEMMARGRIAWQQDRAAAIKAAEKAAEENKKKKESLKLEDTEVRSVTGPNAVKTNRRLHKRGYDNDETTLIFAPDGREIHNDVEASELVYSGNLRREAYGKLGFDIGRTHKGNFENNYTQGVITHDGKTYRTRYNPNANGGKGAVEYSTSGRTGSWKPSPRLTEIYTDYRARYESNLAGYKGSELYDLATIDPDKQNKDYERYRVTFDTPLTEFKASAMSKPENSTGDIKDTYIARRGTDTGDYIERIAGYISSGMRFKDASGTNTRWDRERHINKGFSSGIHEMNKYGTMERRAVKDADSVFTFKDGKITNITEMKITPASIIDAIDNYSTGDGYIIVKTTSGKEYAVGLNLFGSETLNNIFADSRKNIKDAMRDPYLSDDDRELIIDALVKQTSKEIKGFFGYGVNTVSEGGTSSSNIKL